MTVCVAIVTNEVIVFGCDSIASQAIWAYVPSSINDEDFDAEGLSKHRLNRNELFQMPHTILQGVNKMFPLARFRGKHGENEVVTAVGLTSGVAHLQGQNIADLAYEFCYGSQEEPRPYETENIVKKFHAFMKGKYDESFGNYPQGYRPELSFLIGGVRKKRPLQLYQVNIHDPEEDAIQEITEGIGVIGQANAIERFLMGRDFPLQQSIEVQHLNGLAEARTTTIEQCKKAVHEVLKGASDKAPLLNDAFEKLSHSHTLR